MKLTSLINFILLKSPKKNEQIKWLPQVMILFLSSTLVLTPEAGAEPFTEFQKITLGPEDQLEGSMDSQNQLLVFTRRSQMISQIFIMDHKKESTLSVLTPESDATQARWSPSQKILFTYFNYNSRGDICFSKNKLEPLKLPLRQEHFSCIPEDTTDSQQANLTRARSQGQWINDFEILYIEQSQQQNSVDLIYKIKTYHLSTHQFKVLYETKNTIVSPSLNSGGRYFIFTEVENKISKLVIGDLSLNQIQNQNQSSTSTPVRFQKIDIHLPGHSGMVHLSPGEEFIYFSQFMTDSNNDREIDGHDNGVIWRIPFHKLLNSQVQSFPTFQENFGLEQLTPLNNNCSFPFITEQKLILTCAFGGSLDIYMLPHQGVIPTDWDEKKLENAYKTSRSYDDRILIINNLKLKSNNPDLKNKYNLKSLYLHLLNDNKVAALFYANELEKYDSEFANSSLNSFLKIYLDIKELQKKRTALLSFEDQEQITKLLQEIKKLPDSMALKNIKLWIHQWVKILQNNSLTSKFQFLKESTNQVAKSDFTSLEIYVLKTILEMAYPPGSTSLKDWSLFYQEVLKQKDLSLESQVYYGHEFLKILDLNTNPALKTEVLKNLLIQLQATDQGKVISPLFEIESLIHDLILSKDDKFKMIQMQKIDQLMLANKSNYFLRKAMNVRGILKLSESQELQKLNLVAANWLRDTDRDSTEFSYAKDVVITTALEQGYGFLIQEKARLAADYFFQSLSLTDDLESHTLYAHTMVGLDQKNQLNERIQYLAERNKIPLGESWLNLLLTLHGGPRDIPTLEKCLSILKTLPQDSQDPLIYFMKGTLYLSKIETLVLENKKQEIHNDEMNEAHSNLILAMDLAKENLRLKAAALTNLGLLHLRMQNYGRSVQFFELRKNLGFVNQDKNPEYDSFVWYFAEALYFYNVPEKSVELLKTVSVKKNSQEFLERQAFYSMAAKKWTEALVAYSKLEHFHLGLNFEKLSDPSRSKLLLAKGFSHFQLKQFDEAKKIFLIIEELQKFTQTFRNPKQKLDLNSRDFLILTSGFLSQIGTISDKKIALEKRIQWLKETENLELLILSYMQMSSFFIETQDYKQAHLQLTEALQHAKTFSTDNGFFSPAVTQTLINNLVFGLAHKEIHQDHTSRDQMVLLQDLALSTLNAFQKQRESANTHALFEEFKIQYLWLLYQDKVLLKKVELNPPALQSLSQNLKSRSPKEYETLKTRFDGL